MNISKTIGFVTAGIPIVGILIGGITFGINFKTDVEDLKEDVAYQEEVSITMEERFSELNVPPYDDSLLWLQTDTLIERIDDIYIPDGYDDSNINTRLQELALDLTSLQVEVNGIEVGDTSDLQAQVAELTGQLSALSSMDMTSDDGSVDLGPLIVRIATVEGSMTSLKSSVDAIKGDIRTMKSDITTLERQPKSDGSTKTIENRYDDSDLRSRISTVERQVNSLPTTNNSGSTIQRVENPFDDSSLRSDIALLQTAVAVLQATPGQSYDDSALWDRIDDIQWELDNIEIPTVSGSTDTGWLEELIYNVKEELEWRVNELEWAATATGSDDDRYADKWMVEDLQMEVMFIQEQVWKLQELANEYENSQNDTTANDTTGNFPTEGRTWEGSWNEPYWIYVDHKDNSTNHSYTGDYWLDGYWNGEAVWTNWVCGIPPWDICHIYKYNHTSWVLQPSEPGNDWLANAYNDNGQWPWEGSWSGDVNQIEVKGEN